MIHVEWAIKIGTKAVCQDHACLPGDKHSSQVIRMALNSTLCFLVLIAIQDVVEQGSQVAAESIVAHHQFHKLTTTTHILIVENIGPPRSHLTEGSQSNALH